jgi:rhodanese-related sulfurtransferase
MKPLQKLAIGLLIPGIIIAFVPQKFIRQNQANPQQILEEILSGTQFISPEDIAGKILNRDTSILLIDVRPEADFKKFNLTGSINIPLQEILSAKWKNIFNQNKKMNIFYSNGNLLANQAWLLARQAGYQKNYILKGGINYWVETFMNPKAEKTLNPDDEITKYDFSKNSGNNSININSSVNKPSRKKGASGSCE